MKAALAFAVALSAASAAVPQFAQEWSAFIVSDLVQNQGTFNGPNDSLCCDINAIDCQVQVQSQGGMTYFSLSRNATSQINGPGQDPYAIVTLFNDNREYAVDANWNCEEFCPNGGEVLTPFGVDGYTDMGPSTVCTDSGCVAGELWQSVDTFPIGNVTMETDDFYVNQTNMANAVPIIDVDTLTPFGEYIGQSNTTYMKWAPGPQPDQFFTVNGKSTCQRAQNCNSGVRQAYRLATRQKKLWLNGFVQAKLDAAKAQLAAAQEQMNALAATQ